MRTFATLLKRELASCFYSPIAYVMLIFFLFAMGSGFWVLVSTAADEPAVDSVMRALFSESIHFWVAMLVVAPVLTMRLFAEENRTGTIETLMTAPVRDTEVVLAKFAGSFFFFIVMWFPTFCFPYIVSAYMPESMTVDPWPIVTSYVGAFLIGSFFLSVGLFASSLTRNQVTAAIISFTILSGFFFIGFMPYFVRDRLMQDAAGYISPLFHMMDFSRGVLDSRPIILYLSLTAFFLFLTVKAVESRHWKS